MAYQSNIQPYRDQVWPAMKARKRYDAQQNVLAAEEAVARQEAEAAQREGMVRQEAGALAASGDMTGARDRFYQNGMFDQAGDLQGRMDDQQSQDREQQLEFFKATGPAVKALMQAPKEQRPQLAQRQAAMLGSMYPGSKEYAFQMLEALDDAGYSDDALGVYAGTLGETIDKEEAKLMSLPGGQGVGVFRDGELTKTVGGQSLDNRMAEYEAKAEIDAKYDRSGGGGSGGAKKAWSKLDDGRLYNTYTGETRDVGGGEAEDDSPFGGDPFGRGGSGGTRNAMIGAIMDTAQGNPPESWKDAGRQTAERLPTGSVVTQNGVRYQKQPDGSFQEVSGQ